MHKAFCYHAQKVTKTPNRLHYESACMSRMSILAKNIQKKTKIDVNKTAAPIISSVN